ncbi:MAG: hypothetical protein R3C11_24015 [Planctomycetaceae bacterium]
MSPNSSRSFTALTSLFIIFSISAQLNFAQAEEEAELKPIQFEEPNLDHPVSFEDEILPILEDNCISCTIDQ